MTEPHIFTLTGNLLAERTMEFASWEPGRTHRATRESFQVGGKGINVSKMLNRLGAPNTALCFSGGATGAECESWLQARGFGYRSFTSRTPTRAGLVVRGGKHAETTFLGQDMPPDPAALREAAGYLDEQADGQVLVLCGSFPGWPRPGFDPMRAAIARWTHRGEVVADTYGPPLVWSMAEPIELIKVNASELRGVGFAPEEALPDSPSRWVVTDGPRSIRIRDAGEAEKTLEPPRVHEASATGSGDVLLACMLHGVYHLKMTLREAVAFGMPYATANAAHPGIAEWDGPP